MSGFWYCLHSMLTMCLLENQIWYVSNFSVVFFISVMVVLAADAGVSAPDSWYLRCTQFTWHASRFISGIFRILCFDRHRQQLQRFTQWHFSGNEFPKFIICPWTQHHNYYRSKRTISFFHHSIYSNFKEILQFNYIYCAAFSFKGFGRSATEQAGFQALGIVSTIVFALIGGFITGVILKLQGMRNLKKDEHHDDDIYWNVPDDYKNI